MLILAVCTGCCHLQLSLEFSCCRDGGRAVLAGYLTFSASTEPEEGLPDTHAKLSQVPFVS